MIVNKPSLDWVTATTNHFRKYQVTAWEVTPGDQSGKRGKWLQYKGDQYEGIFHGQAQQGSKTSYLLKITGGKADSLGEVVLKNEMKVTRLDIQLTVALPDWFDARELHDEMALGVWPGQWRTVSMIQNGGNDTVYIGHRSSDRFIRIYVKETSYIRFEVEFKAERAVRAAKMIAEGGDIVKGAILSAEMDKLPSAAILDVFQRYLAGSEDVKVKYLATEKLGKIRWIARILNSIEQSMNDHDYGDMVAGWFEEMIIRRGTDDKQN